MIDPSIADLMHYLDRPMPALMRADAAGQQAGLHSQYHAEGTREAVERAEAMSAAWIEETERRVRIIIEDCKDGPLSEVDLGRLNHLLARMQASVEADAKSFLREQKWGRRAVREIRAGSAADGRVAAGLIRRYLATLANRGRAKAELMFVVRSVISEADAATRTGPVFDDPKALGAYLRSSIA